MSSSGLSCLWHVFASYLQSILFIVLQFLLVLHPIGHPIYSEAIFIIFISFACYLQCRNSCQLCILDIIHPIYSAAVLISFVSYCPYSSYLQSILFIVQQFLFYSPSYLYVHPVHSTTYLFCMQFIDCPCNYVALVCHIAYVIIIPHW